MLLMIQLQLYIYFLRTSILSYSYIFCYYYSYFIILCYYLECCMFIYIFIFSIIMFLNLIVFNLRNSYKLKWINIFLQKKGQMINRIIRDHAIAVIWIFLEEFQRQRYNCNEGVTHNLVFLEKVITIIFYFKNVYI